MPSLTAALIAWAVAGPLLAGGLMWSAMRAHNALEMRGAVAGERARQVGICAKQLADQANSITANVSAGVVDAGEAADAVAPTPTIPSEIIDLCRTDAACRDREVAR